MFVYNYSHWWFLPKAEFPTCFIPELMAVGLDERSLDAIHHDAAVIGKYCQDFCHDFLQFAAMTADEDGIGNARRRVGGSGGFEEVAYMDVDAWGTEATGGLVDDSLALRAYLEGFYMQMGEL